MLARRRFARWRPTGIFVVVVLIGGGFPLTAQVAPEPDAPPSQAAPESPAASEAMPEPTPASEAAPASQLEVEPPASGGPLPAASNPTRQEAAPPPAATPLVPTLRVSVNLVNLYFVVRDRQGKLVSDLKRSDCEVEEDNQPQKLNSFSVRTDLPLSIGILLDTSLSQQRVLPQEQKAAAEFLQRTMQPKDEAFLLSFDVSVDMMADWTGSAGKLRQVLDSAQINSSSGNYATGTVPSLTKPKGTLLYDAVYVAATEKLRQETGRKVMVLLTDGQDEGSEKTLASAMEAAQKADAVVYVLLIADSGLDGVLDSSGEGSMRKLAEATGGKTFSVGGNARKLVAAFDEIERQMRTEYQVTYTPMNRDFNGAYRRIRVTCQQDGQALRVQARQGYYAVPR